MSYLMLETSSAPKATLVFLLRDMWIGDLNLVKSVSSWLRCVPIGA